MKKLLLIFLVGHISAAGLDLDSCISNIRIFTNDIEITGITPRYSSGTLTDVINHVQYDTVNLTWCLNYEKRETLPANTTYYTLPDNTFAVSRVVHGTNTLKIISYRELDSEEPNWQNESAGAPARYYIKIATFTSAPVIIGLFPPPNSTRTLTVGYVLIATELSNGSDTLFNGEKRLYTYHSLITLKVSAIINRIRGFSNLANSQESDYIALLKSMSDTIRIKPGGIPKDIKSP